MILQFGFPEKPASCVLSLGAFDGLHRGHKKIIEKVQALAVKHGIPSAAITFHPHPRRVLTPGNAPLLLTALCEKMFFLSECGMDMLVVLPFTKKFSKTPAETFVKNVLFRNFHPADIVIGYDFSFGKDRHGSRETIQKYAKLELPSCRLFVVPPVKHKNEIISSTRIRQLLEKGSVSEAARCLGHPYFVFGEVVQGRQRGKALGFPTANLRLAKDKLLPGNGVYAVRVRELPASFKGLETLKGKHHVLNLKVMKTPASGVANLGTRPTFSEKTRTLEVHLLNFKKNLYGKMLLVEFVRYLRREKKFNSIPALKNQIQKDIARTKAFLQ